MFRPAPQGESMEASGFHAGRTTRGGCPVVGTSSFPIPKKLPYFFSFFLFSLAAPRHMEIPGQGSDLSSSLNLCCSLSNAGSLTGSLNWILESTVSLHSQDAVDPVVPQRELQVPYFRIRLPLSSHSCVCTCSPAGQGELHACLPT